MINDRCLPIVKNKVDGSRYYCDYWVNYCDGFPVWIVSRQVKELESVWGGKLYDVIGQHDLAHIEFETAEQLTLFLLRWS